MMVVVLRGQLCYEEKYGSVKLAVPGVGTADESSRVPRPMLCPSGLAQHWPYYGTTVRRPPPPPAIDPLPAQQVSRYPVRPVTGGRCHPPP